MPLFLQGFCSSRGLRHSVHWLHWRITRHRLSIHTVIDQRSIRNVANTFWQRRKTRVNQFLAPSMHLDVKVERPSSTDRFPLIHQFIFGTSLNIIYDITRSLWLTPWRCGQIIQPYYNIYVIVRSLVATKVSVSNYQFRRYMKLDLKRWYLQSTFFVIHFWKHPNVLPYQNTQNVWQHCDLPFSK